MLTRRHLLATIAAAGAAAAAGEAAVAQEPAQKLKPEEVAYQTTPMGDQRCSNCAEFTPPSRCAILTTRVAPSGWCAVWSKKAT